MSRHAHRPRRPLYRRLLPFQAETVRRVLRDPERKPLWKVVFEAARYGLHKGEVPRQYFHSLLYQRRMHDVQAHMTHREYWKLRRLVERKDLVPYFDDKLRFQRHFETAPGVRLPRHVGYVDGGVVFSPDGTAVSASTRDSFEAALRGMLEHGSALFAKPLADYGGKGIFRIDAQADLAPLWEAVQESGYIIQEEIEQHADLCALHATSINTMRITTTRYGGHVHVSGARLRFGRGGSVVDNGTSGGACVALDRKTGRGKGPAVSQFKTGGTLYRLHPDTGIELEGFAVPYFDEALAMARAAASHLPYPIVGWDVAIATDGPVIVEGNHNPDYHGDERVNGGYLANPHVLALIDELTEGRGL